VLDTIRKRRLDGAEALSFALEVPFSLLLAPLLFYLHTTFVLGILRGRVTPWISPSRNPGETLPLRTAVQMFWLPGTLALGLTALAWWLVPSFLVYLLAIIVGWAIAIPMAAGSSRSLGNLAIWLELIPVEDIELVCHSNERRDTSGC
jgi:membrane glycosyltransferase